MLFRLQKKSGLNIAIIGATSFFILTLLLALHRHFTFYSSYDLGIFNQVFWNGIHGRFFQSSLSSQLSTNVVHAQQLPEVYYHRLGQHFTPALLLWLPIYYLFPHPATLIVIQVTLVTAAGLVLFVLARQYLEPHIAAMFSISFYGSNAIIGPTLANFHDICQIPLFIFTILLALEKRWWWLFALLSIILVTVREDSGIALFSIGFYLIVSRRFVPLGLVVCVFSLIYLLVLTNLIMPIFSDDISKRFMLERFGQYVEGQEASTVDVIVGMVTKPWLLLQELVSPPGQTLLYLLGQTLPLAFVPFLSPASWLVPGFPLLKLFLGQGGSVLSINIRYAMVIVPGLFYGAIFWWAGQGWKNFHTPLDRLKSRKLTFSFKRFWVFCLCLSLLFTFTSNPNRSLSFLVPDSFAPWVYVSPRQRWQHSSHIYPILAKIPPDASVSATTYLIPHLSSRREIIRLDDLQLRNDQKEIITVDYVIADLWQLLRYQLAFGDDRAKLKSIIALLDQVIPNSEYGVIAFEDGVILLQKATSSNPDSLAAWSAFRRDEIEPIFPPSKN